MATIPVVRRLQDEAYDYLKEQIQSGELVEGELYSETRITSILGISRTPVRDALLRLSMEGLVEILPSRGFSVKKASRTEIRETLEIRMALEGYAAYILAEQSSTTQGKEALFRLNELVNEQERVLDAAKFNVMRYVELNSQFHNVMIDYLGNEAIVQAYRRYESRIREMTYRRFSSSPESARETLKSHIQLVALIRSGNPEQAFTRVRLHNDEKHYM